TVISSVIMVAAVAMLGSVVLIWANSSLNVERTKISDDFSKNSNLLRETFIVEDIWLEPPPPENSVNITIRNIGDIAINVTSINITAINAAGANPCGSACTINLPLNAVIDIKQTRTIVVSPIDWDYGTASQSLDITITTSRGTVEQISWRVRQ
ncbi:MAG: hypothetical protein ACRD5H_17370, partial [Nitrososphaerales archaeon]